MLKLFLYFFLLIFISGCSNKEELLKIKFEIKNLKVNETNNSWNSQSDPTEAPFFALSFDKNYFVGGTFVFKENEIFVKGQVNFIDNSTVTNDNDLKNIFKKSIVGYWPIINCYNNSFEILGIISNNSLFERNIVINESCLYIEVNKEVLELNDR